MTQLIDLILPILRDSPGGVGSLRLKQEVEKQTGQRFNLQLWDDYLRKLGSEGVIVFTGMEHGGICHHPDDPIHLCSLKEQRTGPLIYKKRAAPPREGAVEPGDGEEAVC